MEASAAAAATTTIAARASLFDSIHLQSGSRRNGDQRASEIHEALHPPRSHPERIVRSVGAAYACSMEICMNQSWGESRAPFIQYFMHRINLLRHHKIVPVVIFDGGCIPCKSATELERQRRRATNLSLAKEKLSQGDMSAAIEFFQTLKAEQVEFIVAPYEADAQLAYLSKLEEAEGGISAVITEDSDLLAYGCRAVIFKMDRYGHGEEILMDDVLKPNACGLSFRNFDQELFTGMCVLAGCDFLPSVPGIGIKRAHLLVSKYRNLDRVLSILKFDKSRQMPDGYAEAFRAAAAVFHHAIM
ncbi:Exonuclease 1 [Nymphaea thermarum]|nr:Exonuclease 1 [Nymphaea thermarum]